MIGYHMSEKATKETIPKKLNFGCGADFKINYLNHDIELPFEQMRLCDREKFCFSEGEITSVYSLPSNHFEKIVAVMVLEHFSPEELPELLYFLRCSMEPGGHFFAIVPNFSKIAEVGVYEQDEHITSLLKATYHLLSPQRDNTFYGHKSLWTVEYAIHLFRSSQFKDVTAYPDPDNTWNLIIQAIK